ncbi:MAG TPA: hypothetical protein VEY06_14860 [Flavisolibacter sp.]|nr:hypothetical protein [Flavisolibacter sp.]
MTEDRSILSSFFSTVRFDHRLGATHVSVYMALYAYWSQNDFQSPLPITRQEVMQAAKISGLATYHKCMRDLHAYGYIRYEPSFHPARHSQVCLLQLQSHS